MKNFIKIYTIFFSMLLVTEINSTANAIGWGSNNPGAVNINTSKYLVPALLYVDKTDQFYYYASFCTATFLSPRVLLTAKHCTNDIKDMPYLAMYAQQTNYLLRFPNFPNINTVQQCSPDNYANCLVASADLYQIISINPSNIRYFNPSIDAALIILDRYPILFTNGGIQATFPQVINAKAYFANSKMVPGTDEQMENGMPLKNLAFGEGYGTRHSYSMPESKVGFNRITTNNRGHEFFSQVYLHSIDSPWEREGGHNQIIQVSYQRSNVDGGDSGGPLFILDDNMELKILGIAVMTGSPIRNEAGENFYVYSYNRGTRALTVDAYVYFTENDINEINNIIRQN